MAEPVGEDRQVKFFFEYDPRYSVVAANGAWAGVTTRGDIRIDFFVEGLGNPDQVVNLITPNGHLGPELSRSPERRFVRRMQVGVLLRLEEAESIADFIKKQVADFRKQQEDFQKRREEER